MMRDHVGILAVVFFLQKCLLYALPKSCFEYESDFSEDVYAYTIPIQKCLLCSAKIAFWIRVCSQWGRVRVDSTCTNKRRVYNTYTKMPSMLWKNRVLNTSLISVKTCTRRQYMYQYVRKKFRNDHIMVTAPLPVCSAKLSTIGPG